MESNIDAFFNNIDAEHTSLTDQVTGLENEKLRLTYQNDELQKALDKQKLFHRNYADEVASMERIRIRDFNEEKRSLSEQIKNLNKANRQLNKDVEFYKQAHEELTLESDRAVTLESSRTSESTVKTPVSTPPVTTKIVTRSIVKATATSESSQTTSTRPLACECTHTSSKVLIKVNNKMFQDTKKLNAKINTLSATIAMLKKKNKQLENFRNKIENKKLKFSEDSAELERLIESSKKKNKHTFNEGALAMLRELI